MKRPFRIYLLGMLSGGLFGFFLAMDLFKTDHECQRVKPIIKYEGSIGSEPELKYCEDEVKEF